MSWDISVFASARAPSAVEQMPGDWRGVSLGSAAAVRAQITRIIPDVDWSNPLWGRCERTDFTLEFNMGGKEAIDGFMIHVRGGGDVVGLLLDLAKSTGWYLLDCSEGEWFHHHPNPDRSWRGFQEYRDQVNQSEPAQQAPER